MKDIMLIVHFIGLAMGIGTSFAFMFIGIASKKMEPQAGATFRKNALSISRMGHIGLTLLVLSGIYLITPYWDQLGENPILITKLILVVVLGALIGMIGSNAKRAIRDNDIEKFKRVGNMGKLGLLLGITIVVLAVMQFH